MKLKKLEINSGGGIGPVTGPVVIDFSQSNFVKLAGDNGAGKTSVIKDMLLALGEIGGKKVLDQLVNKDSGTVDVSLEFDAERKSFVARATKSNFYVRYEGDKNDLPEPMTLMRRLLGPTGVAPLEMKTKSIDDQIKWLAGFTTKNPEEFQKAIQKNKDGVKTAEESRAAANRSAKGLIEYLSSEGISDEKGNIIEKAWTEREKKYAKDVDLKALSTELDEAGKASDKLLQAETALKQLQSQETAISDQITALQAQLVEVQDRLKRGRKIVEDNKDAKKNYDAVKSRYDTAATDSANYRKWKEIKVKKTELDGYQDMSQKADARAKELLSERAEMQAELLPNIKGMKLYVEDTHEDEKMIKAGLYLNGVSAAQMSSGEWIKLVIEILKKNKVKIIIIDNAEMLGTEGYDLLTELSEKGCYILIAEVSRGKQELEIEYQ